MLRPDKLLDLLSSASRHWTSPLQSADLFPHCAIHLITSCENSFTPDPLDIKNTVLFLYLSTMGYDYLSYQNAVRILTTYNLS